MTFITFLITETGKVIVAGGITTANDYTNSVEIFDPATGIWTKGPDLPDNRWGGKATVTGEGQVSTSGRED